MPRIKYNKVEDFIKGVLQARFQCVYFDTEKIPQQFKVQTPPRYTEDGRAIPQPDQVITRMTVLAKLTATDDKTYMLFSDIIIQKDMVGQNDTVEIDKAVTDYMDKIVNELQDKIPSIQRKSGVIEPNPLG